ncbi:MAG: beta-ketoacyl synthase N-terminal-like domain-containing protein, partial [Thermoanaerobaculia bacterium]
MRKPDLDTRLAVTGAGIICSIGRNKAEVWESVEHARAGIGPLTRFPGETFPTDLAAEVTGDLGALLPVSRREAKRMSRTDQLAVIAAAEAIEESERGAASALPRDRTVVSSGTSTGGLFEGERFFVRRSRSGSQATAVSNLVQQPTSSPSDAVARVFALGGGVISNATACASAGAAIGIAADLLRARRADAVVAGGSDALCRITYSGFNVLQAVDPQPCTPFGVDRKGITLGEGAAYLVVERWDDAVARGAGILAELCG